VSIVSRRFLRCCEKSCSDAPWSGEMSVTLVLPESIYTDLERTAQLQVETAGVLTARVLDSGSGSQRLLARQFSPVPDSSYLRRQPDGLTINSAGYVPALGRAEADGAMAIWVHIHPGVGSSPRPSQHDRIVDHELSDVFRLRAGSQYYGTLILSPRSPGVAFTGHLHPAGRESLCVDRLWIVGDRLRFYHSVDFEGEELSPSFDRNVRAFGAAVQQILAALRVGIVGCGGTGSAVAEQLVRLGARHFTLVDPDTLSASNVTRVYGSTPADIGEPKVHVVARHLQAIAGGKAHIREIPAMLTQRWAAEALTDLDVAFGCTDDNAGRLVLSRASSYLLLPVIDCGVLLTSATNGTLDGIDGRVTTMVPGRACLVCRGRIDLARAASELLTPSERRRRVDEGYAPALLGVEPAVVTFTTSVASTAVAELLECLIGYGPDPRPSEVLLRYHDREISTNSMFPCKDHYCDPAAGKIGLGRTEPFLEQTWGQ